MCQAAPQRVAVLRTQTPSGGWCAGDYVALGANPRFWVEPEFDHLLIGTPDPETVLSHLKPLARD